MQQYRSDEKAPVPVVAPASIQSSSGRFLSISALSGENLAAALEQLNCKLRENKLNKADIVQVQLFLRDLSQFNTMNAAYSEFFKGEPSTPTRLCVEANLPASQPFIMNVTAKRAQNSNSLKVTSRSNWACSVVGPYSQAVMAYEDLFLSGIIGLRPMEHLLAAGASNQLRLACSHRDQLIDLMASRWPSRHQSMYSFITSEDIATGSSIQCKDSLGSFSILVSCLPRGASVEIAARLSPSGWAHYCAAAGPVQNLKAP